MLLNALDPDLQDTQKPSSVIPTLFVTCIDCRKQWTERGVDVTRRKRLTSGSGKMSLNMSQGLSAMDAILKAANSDWSKFESCV